MKIHEYQAKELFKKYNIPVPAGSVAFNPEEANKIASKLDQLPVVVKLRFMQEVEVKEEVSKSQDQLTK